MCMFHRVSIYVSDIPVPVMSQTRILCQGHGRYLRIDNYFTHFEPASKQRRVRLVDKALDVPPVEVLLDTHTHTHPLMAARPLPMNLTPKRLQLGHLASNLVILGGGFKRDRTLGVTPEDQSPHLLRMLRGVCECVRQGLWVHCRSSSGVFPRQGWTLRGEGRRERVASEVDREVEERG